MPRFQTLSGLLLTAVLAACASKAPAPVETRDTSRTKAVVGPVVSSPSAPSVSSSPAAPAAARPGYYVVKKGDTLYSIAMENGHSYREVASWNNIDNPALIAVGQELRVQPPEAPVASSAGTRPVVVPRIESRPLDQSAPVATQSGAVAGGATSAPVVASGVASANATGIVTEPRGGRMAYSDKAWKDLQAAALAQSEPKAAPAVASAPVAVPKAPSAASSAPVAAPVASASSSSAPLADAAVKTSDEGIEWSWPSGGKVLGTFNDSSNKGVDIGGAIGDPVVAAASGKVIYAGSALRGYGNLVIIQHAAQYTSVYAHNKEILVKENQSVQKGQKIAVMGDSDSDKPKLHFEVRKQGKPADPLKFLPTR
ncbi:peptidoglycan DD-metalloendopeptidase family protein [Uliginosibacterium sp. H3]|uniref:Peptidoglycan DD-metalloendopeptidase family protein n=1 Tax=Uliginosibacterium silvisoli TaxID=3114758 RepID=A0ABU6KA78_9RHOO|nr:peptidoglycan DD-metalloendopeptidase family protein [Uliginosibacterium sp. H3]